MSSEESNSSVEYGVMLESHNQITVSKSALNGQPHVEIVEQPKSRGFRFRYECEGKSHGGIQGESSGKNKKTYPTVKIHNYSGRARVVAKLVTDETNPRPHAHKLIGKNCKDGICSVEANTEENNGVFSFPNMGIQHVTKKLVVDILKTRLMEDIVLKKVLNDQLHQLDYNEVELTVEEKKQALEMATHQSKEMSLNVVKLCFQVHLADPRGRFSHILPPVFTNPIYDCKSPGAAALKICRMDKHAGCCIGNDEVFLLCDKVQKEDIEVRFFESNADSEITWQASGNFGPTDVHRQYAIVFRTPPYCNPNITKPVNVHVQLVRRTDGETSEPKPFTYYPQQKDQDEVLPKRQKPLPYMNGLQVNDNVVTAVNNNPVAVVTQPINGTGVLNNGFPFQGNIIISSNNLLNGNNVLSANHQNVFLNPTENTTPMSTVQIHPAPIQIQPQNSVQMMGRGCDSVDHISKLKAQTKAVPETKMRSRKEMILRGHNRQMDQLETDACGMDETDSAPCIESMKFDSGVEISVTPKASDGLAQPAGGKCSIVSHLSQLSLKDAKTSTKHEDSVEIQAVADLKCENGQEVQEEQEPDSTVDNVDHREVGQQENVQQNVQPESVETEAKTEDKPADDIQECAWRVAENTALAMQEFAKTGNIAYLLLIQRHLVAVQDSNGDNALHMAVIHRKVEPLRSLLCVAATLSENPAINTYNSLQQTPLHLAVVTNQPDMVEVLVNNHADLSVVDRNGNTAIHLAAMLGFAGCLSNLMSFVSSKLSPAESRKLLKVLNYDGFTPVHLSVREGHMPCLRHLVMADADVNIQDGKSGYTALHHATDCENLGIVGYLLLDAAAEPNCPAYNGVSALHVAVGKGSLAIAALLIASGADPYAECTELPSEEGCVQEEGQPETEDYAEVKGMTPIDMAMGNSKMVSVLNGDGYTMFSSHSPDTTAPEEVSLYSEILDSGLGIMATDAGDLEMLDLVTRMKLARILDQAEKNSNWQALAKHFKMDQLCEALSTMKSPTQALIDNLEVLDGTVSKLKEALSKMGRTDCIEVIEEGLALNKQAAHDLVQKRKKEAELESFSGVPRRIDSGVVTSNRVI